MSEPPNIRIELTALRAAAHTERWTDKGGVTRGGS